MEAIQEQLDKLKQAKHACLECGERKLVTDAEHFGFFYRGLCKLRIHKARLERYARAQSEPA